MFYNKVCSLKEFIGEQARPKTYENGNKKVLGLNLTLVGNVEIYTSSTFLLYSQLKYVYL